MPVGQNLMALLGADFSRDTVSGIASGRSKAGDSGAVAAFSAILAEQTPEDLDALMQRLAQGAGADQAGLALPALVAADGKDLPGSMQSWFQQLAQLVGSGDGTSAEDVAAGDGLAGDDPDSMLAGISEQWQQWLARLPSQEADAATESGDGALTPGVNPAVAALAAVDAAAQAASADGEAGDPLLAGGGRGLSGADLAAQLRALLRGEAQAGASADTPASARDAATRAAEGVAGQAEANSRQLLADTQQQRVLQGVVGESPASVGKLIEQLESRLAARAGGLDAESADAGKGAAAAQLHANGQSALTARPVTGVVQTLGVPMGQAGWSEAVVNKVMWMSSQNVKSVEIQLDPAELGPLEIRIQTRGQEHQVQFVSQHAGVRDALEGQMHRLREMFSQQGASLVDVNVSDGSADGRQSENAYAGLADQGGSRGSSSQAAAASRGADEIPADDPVAVLQTRLAAARLVDYYA